MSNKNDKGAKGAEPMTPATLPQGGVATAVPDYLKSMAGMGNENVTRENLAVPRLVLLQALSPEVTVGHEKYIEDARPSEIMNTVTGQRFKGTEGVLVINTYFEHEFAVFKKRDAGGGFRGTFATEKEARAHVDTFPDKDQLEINEQDVHYVLILDEERNYVGEAAIVMASTKLAVSRKWNSFIQLGSAGAPRFAQVWRLKSVSAKNQKGAFFNFSVSPSGFIPEILVTPAVELYKAVKEGKKKVERKNDEDHGGGAATGGAPVDDHDAGFSN